GPWRRPVRYAASYFHSCGERRECRHALQGFQPPGAAWCRAGTRIALRPAQRGRAAAPAQCAAAAQKNKARRQPGLVWINRYVRSVLDVQLGATVLGATFRIVRTIRIGVRGNRAALAVADRTLQARRGDTVG